jgi:nicotinamide-nucleotide amidase
MLPTGEIIAIGDELTTGQRLDTNTQWLSEQLTRLGVRVLFHTTVADDLAANVAVFRVAVERADYVVATGGLGPTADDLTRDALAAAAGVELVQDDLALERVRSLFERRGRPMPERNVVQALFPEGSRPIANDNGTAPGVAMEIARAERSPCRLFALPGVPAEMFPMWETSVAPAIMATLPTKSVTRHRRIKCFGAGESQIEAMLPEMIRRGREPLVGITASGATITLRITSTAADEATCLADMEPTVAEIRQLLGMYVFGEEEMELEDTVVQLLGQRNQTLTSHEGATRGELAQLLAAAASDHECFAGGSVVPGSHDLLSQRDATTLTEQLARSIRTESSTDYGLAVSEQFVVESDPDATSVTIALASETDVRSKTIAMFGDPAFARLRTAKVALNLVRLEMLRRD